MAAGGALFWWLDLPLAWMLGAMTASGLAALMRLPIYLSPKIRNPIVPVIGAMLGHGSVPPEVVRRNLVVSGLNLSALKGRHVAIGGCILEITGICAPCSRMEDALGHGGYSAMRGHGGWCARAVQAGTISLGDQVVPLTTHTP